MLLISFSQVHEQNFDEIDRLPEADSSVLLLGSDDQLAISARLVWQNFKVCLAGLFVSSWWHCWCTPSVTSFATYLTVQNSQQAGASILIKISGSTLHCC